MRSPRSRDFRIVVLGCGVVGLPLAVTSARTGIRTVGVDVDPERVQALSLGDCAAIDPRLSDRLNVVIREGALIFTDAPERADTATVYVIAVPTPAGASGGLDRRHLDGAISMIAGTARPRDLVIVRSTVPIGTTRAIAAQFAAAGVDVDVACCPDRSLAGLAFQEAIPEIVGGVTAVAASRAAGIWSAFSSVISVSSAEAAEALKLFANVQRDVLFGLSNEFALICEAVGIDMFEILEAGAKDYPRHVLPRPGPVGGACLTKDAFLLAANPAGKGAYPQIALTSRARNESLIDHIEAVIRQSIADRNHATIAVLGLAFRGTPPTPSTQQSLGATIAHRLAADHVRVRGWDPEVGADVVRSLDIEYAADAYQAVYRAHVVVLANDHEALARLDLDRIADAMAIPGLIYDACGQFRRRGGQLREGVRFVALGVGTGGAGS